MLASGSPALGPPRTADNVYSRQITAAAVRQAGLFTRPDYLPMRIDRSELIAGIPILKIRDFLRWASGDEWRLEALCDRLKISKHKAQLVLRELIARGWVERMPKDKWSPGVRWLRRTLDGGSLASARAVPPIARDKAETMLAELLRRVVEVNANDHLAYVVTEVRVFGSFLDAKRRELGDIDLVLVLDHRAIEGRDIAKYSLERARRSGKSLPSFMARLAYGQNEVLRLLKGGNNYLSFHPASDLVQTGAASKIVFPQKPRSKRK